MSRELPPVAIGFGVGSLLAATRPAMPTAAALLLAIPLGFFVTVVTGEFELGWEYLLVDIPLVALSSTAAFWTVGMLGFLSLAAVFVKALHDYSQPGFNYSHPILGIQVPIVIGIGGLLLGRILMLWAWASYRGFFRRRLEVAPPSALAD